MLPPFNTASRESSRRPDLAFPNPWHLRQCSASTGRISFSKKSYASVLRGPARNGLKIHPAQTNKLRRVNRRGSISTPERTTGREATADSHPGRLQDILAWPRQILKSVIRRTPFERSCDESSRF